MHSMAFPCFERIFHSFGQTKEEKLNPVSTGPFAGAFFRLKTHTLRCCHVESYHFVDCSKKTSKKGTGMYRYLGGFVARMNNIRIIAALVKFGTTDAYSWCIAGSNLDEP